MSYIAALLANEGELCSAQRFLCNVLVDRRMSIVGLCLPSPPAVLPCGMLITVEALFWPILMSPPSAWCLISTVNDVSLDSMPRNEVWRTDRAFLVKELYQVYFKHFGLVVDIITVKKLLDYGYRFARYVK